jgi:hypothetical protein
MRLTQSYCTCRRRLGAGQDGQDGPDSEPSTLTCSITCLHNSVRLSSQTLYAEMLVIVSHVRPLRPVDSDPGAGLAAPGTPRQQIKKYRLQLMRDGDASIAPVKDQPKYCFALH